MEQEVKVWTEEALESEISQLRRSGISDSQLLDMVKADYQYGLSAEEINIYLYAKVDFSKKKLISQAIKECGIDLAKVIANEQLDENRMQVAMLHYGKQVPISAIQKAVEQARNAHEMNKMLERAMAEAKKQEQEAVSAMTDAEKDDFYKKLEEKDVLLGNQQDNIQQLNATLVKTKEELEAKQKEFQKSEDEVQRLQEEVQKLKDEVAQKQKEIEKLQDSRNDEELQQEMNEKWSSLEQKLDDLNEKSERIIEALETNEAKITKLISLCRGGANENSGKAKRTQWFSNFFKRQPKQDIFRLVTSENLSTGQMGQIKEAMKKGLDEKQLELLINANLSVEQMAEVIEIAELENNRGE